ncbi:MAG: AAA family ATPase [Rhizobacter sp.]|nr:AAA family ATPase [Rhizobacter sp.]
MKRFPTGVPGLDELLHGGLFEGGVYILEGPPGAGKTTLANQVAFTLAGRGGKALYVTMLAESHARMLQHMLGQNFCKPEMVNSSVLYVSAYRELEEQGLKAVVHLLRGELVRHQVNLLIVDGLVVENPIDRPEEGVRQFVHELQSLASATGCTCMLLTSGTGRSLNAEQTMVDGIFAFEDYTYQWRSERRIQVRKFRGSAVERGKHTFCITDDGLQFFPRLEGMPPARGKAEEAVAPGAVTPSGLAGLDAALAGGGLPRASSTLLVGASGAGKTTFALSFLAAASPGERGLMLAGTEAPCELLAAADTHGVPLAAGVDSGVIHLYAQSQEDEALDEIGYKLLRRVDEQGARRLVVDGLATLADTVAFPERGARFVGRLLRELKARGVTSVFTLDPAAFAAMTGRDPKGDGLAAWFDNVLALTDAGIVHDGRRLAIGKLRGTRASRSMLDVRLEATGLVVT